MYLFENEVKFSPLLASWDRDTNMKKTSSQLIWRDLGVNEWILTFFIHRIKFFTYFMSTADLEHHVKGSVRWILVAISNRNSLTAVKVPVYTTRPGLRALLVFSGFPGRTFHFLRRKSRKIEEIDSAEGLTRMYELEGQKCWNIAFFMHEPVIAETDFKNQFLNKNRCRPEKSLCIWQFHWPIIDYTIKSSHRSYLTTLWQFACFIQPHPRCSKVTWTT